MFTVVLFKCCVVSCFVSLFQARWLSTYMTQVTAVQRVRTQAAQDWAAGEGVGAAPGRKWVALTLWLCPPWGTQLRRGDTASLLSWSWWTALATPLLTFWVTSRRTRQGMRARRTARGMTVHIGGLDTASMYPVFKLKFHFVGAKQRDLLSLTNICI